jgi:hypothetical protein
MRALIAITSTLALLAPGSAVGENLVAARRRGESS